MTTDIEQEIYLSKDNVNVCYESKNRKTRIYYFQNDLTDRSVVDKIAVVVERRGRKELVLVKNDGKVVKYNYAPYKIDDEENIKERICMPDGSSMMFMEHCLSFGDSFKRSMSVKYHNKDEKVVCQKDDDKVLINRDDILKTYLRVIDDFSANDEKKLPIGSYITDIIENSLKNASIMCKNRKSAVKSDKDGK